VLDRLGLEPWHITRTGEAVAKELGLAGTPQDAEHRGRWLDALVAHPRLIQRPIVTADDGTTVVARDSESLARVLPR
jgi:arsenate reductase